MKPFDVVKGFEQAVAEYTGAPYVVAVNSCSAALMLAVAWHLQNRQPDGMRYKATMLFDHERRVSHGIFGEQKPIYEIEIPKRTYVSVPMSIIHAGGRPTFRDEKWTGAYQLKPLPVWDSARWFTAMMYRAPAWHCDPPFPDKVMVRQSWLDQHAMVCTSHHWSKTLGIQQGGCILHDNPEADTWLRRARFDGRTEGVTPKDDNITMVGWHCYMSPEVAAEGLVRLSHLPRHNDPLPNSDYPDLSTMEVFK